MSAVKDKLFTNWHFTRLVRLSLGILMLFMAFTEKDLMVSLAGLFFVYLAISNTACCGDQICHTAKNDSLLKNKETIDYEEIK